MDFRHGSHSLSHNYEDLKPPRDRHKIETCSRQEDINTSTDWQEDDGDEAWDDWVDSPGSDTLVASSPEVEQQGVERCAIALLRQEPHSSITITNTQQSPKSDTITLSSVDPRSLYSNPWEDEMLEHRTRRPPETIPVPLIVTFEGNGVASSAVWEDASSIKYQPQESVEENTSNPWNEDLDDSCGRVNLQAEGHADPFEEVDGVQGHSNLRRPMIASSRAIRRPIRPRGLVEPDTALGQRAQCTTQRQLSWTQRLCGRRQNE